nr:retrovirus-related Pol polyprotein from transposon TNT 1-94 [Tanacetum cinerariifolium]
MRVEGLVANRVTFANSDKQDLPSRNQVYQGRLLTSFQDDAKYEHGGQDTRLQGGKRRSRQKDKDLKILDEKTKRQSQKAKDQRSQSMKEQAYNVDKDQDKSLTKTAISMNLRMSVTINLLRGRLKKAHFLAEKEAIHLILTGIGDEIYSTVNACQIAQEIWEAMKGYYKIAKPITPPSETTSEEDSNPEQAQRDKDMQNNLALISKYIKKIYKPTNNNLKTSSNSRNKNVDTTPQYKNDDHSRQFGNQRMVNVAGAREKVGSPVVQNDAGYNVFANRLQHSEQSELVSNTCLLETDDSNVTPDSPDMCEDDIQNEQNDVESDDEHVALANLKLDVDENKKIQKQLKKANTTLAQELPSRLSLRSIRYLMTVPLTMTNLNKHDELMKQSLLTKSHYEGLVKRKTKVITDLKLRKEHDIEKMLSMEKQLKFLNEVVYKRSQSIQTIHMLAPKVSTYNGRPAFANPRYFKKAQSKIPCLYAFPYDQNTHANRLILDGEETLALERESRLKTCLMPLAIKTQNDSFKFVHELKQEMNADLKYVESLEKEIDELESDKAEFSDMYDVILQDCVSKDVMCSYLMSLSDLDALYELQCLYLHKVKECDCLAQRVSKQTESVSKKAHTELLQRFAKVEKHSISLEITLQKCKEQTMSVSKANVSEGLSKPVTTETLPQIARQTFAPILGYGDLVQGNVTINRVYYVEGLSHNLFSVGQFCDADLEVAFRKSTCFIRDLQGNDLLTGNQGSDLYTISLQELTSSTPLCLMAKAKPTQAWLWHQRLSHLNFDYINLLSKKDIVIGLPKLKYVKDQLCSSCELSKAKRSSFKSKVVLSSKGRLNLLHIDLCGPMRVASINGKKYILVAFCPGLRFVLDCVLSSTAFCLSEDHLLRFAKDKLCLTQNCIAFCLSLRFASEVLRFDLA